MFYNLHNFFDTVDTPDIDDEVLSQYKFNRKCKNLAEVILSINNGQGPDILGVCEIENDQILKNWANQYMKDAKYKTFVVKIPENNNFRGIHTGLISRFPLANIPDNPKTIPPYPYGIHMLQATLDIDGQFLTIFVCHWKSRIGGVAQTNKKRAKAAKALRKAINLHLKKYPDAEFLVCGDFNEQCNDAHLDPSLEEVLGSTLDPLKVSNHLLFNCWSTLPEKERYSYILFGKTSQNFDHILLPPSLLDSKGLNLVPGSFRAYRNPNFFYKRNGLKIPNRKYSDHFPLLLNLKVD